MDLPALDLPALRLPEPGTEEEYGLEDADFARRVGHAMALAAAALTVHEIAPQVGLSVRTVSAARRENSRLWRAVKKTVDSALQQIAVDASAAIGESIIDGGHTEEVRALIVGEEEESEPVAHHTPVFDANWLHADDDPDGRAARRKALGLDEGDDLAKWQERYGVR